jgi:hypothetical protein
MKPMNHLGGTRIGVWAIEHVVSPLQHWIYRGTGGRVFSAVSAGRNVLLLTTKGRRTGAWRPRSKRHPRPRSVQVAMPRTGGAGAMDSTAV